jgi:hypothetical protein
MELCEEVDVEGPAVGGWNLRVAGAVGGVVGGGFSKSQILAKAKAEVKATDAKVDGEEDKNGLMTLGADYLYDRQIDGGRVEGGVWNPLCFFVFFCFPWGSWLVCKATSFISTILPPPL